MSFIIDKQTLNDLGIFSRNKEISVYDIFNSTKTRGGAEILKEMFYNPLDNYSLISRRSVIIDYYRRSKATFPFSGSWFDAAESYISDTDSRKRQELITQVGAVQNKLKKLIGVSAEYSQAVAGISAIVEIVNTLDRFTALMAKDAAMLDASDELREIREIFDSGPLTTVTALGNGAAIKPEQIADLDAIFHGKEEKALRKMLDYIYQIDVYISIAQVAEERGFVQAEVYPASENLLEFKGLYHPALKKPVANDLTVDKNSNIIFLTGANMAGKSTFMKSFGIALFLAHVGVPVPATSMKFSVRDGMYTTINLPDNLSRGYSHFYAEVRRLKQVALSVNIHRNMIIIFDELFRGTNVKDAYDATVAVTEAFAVIKESIFLISTHIIEAGEELGKLCNNIAFVYLPTKMNGSIPEYTYRLTRGITEDRHGMMIVRNEGILDILGYQE
ncbi:MAG: DNA mismatch repair protein [Muribaculaceae bacterium]|nr:DNA mismatch repair protein [Muribaculaceae bacterium]